MNLRLIEIDKNGVVTLGASKLDEPISARDYAIQNFLITLLMTPGTNVEQPSLGGGLRQLLFKNKIKDMGRLQKEVGFIFTRARDAVVNANMGNDDYVITEASLVKVGRDQSSDNLMLVIQLDFANATSNQVTLPLE